VQALLFVDLVSGSVSGSLGGPAFSWPKLVQGDDVTIALRFSQTYLGAATEVSRVVRSLKASLGAVDARPTASSFKLKLGNAASAAGVNVTSSIPWDASADVVADAINDLSALPGLGLGTASVSASNGSWLITFSTASGAAPITIADNSLQPVSFVRVQAYEFDGRWTNEIRLVQAPVASTSSSARVVPPAPTITGLQDGGTNDGFSWNEVQRLYVPPQFRGTYQIRRGYGKTSLLSRDDGPTEIADALKSLADDDGTFEVTNPAAQVAHIEFTGSMGGIDQPPLEIEIFDAPEGDLTFTLSLDTAELAAALRATGEVKLQLEVEAVVEDEQDSDLTNTLTLIRTEVTVQAELNWAGLGTEADVDWLRPPLPRDYVPFTPDQVITGNQHYQTTLGDGAVSVFTVDHNLATEAVHVALRENKPDGKLLSIAEDYNVVINSANSITITVLGAVPTNAALAVLITSAGPKSAFQSHHHTIAQIDGLEAILDAHGGSITEILARLGISPLSTPSAGSLQPGVTWKLPAFAEIFGVRGSSTEIGKDLSDVDASKLNAKGGGMFAAVHAVSATAADLPVSLAPGTAGVLYKNVSGSAISLPGGFAHKTREVAAGGFAAWDGRQWYALERYPADENFPSYQFWSDASTDLIATAEVNFSAGQYVLISSTGTLPAPLSTGGYWLVNPIGDGQQFKLSATEGGAPIDIINNGTGIHHIARGPRTSFYPTDFDRELFFLAVNDAELRPGFMFELFFGLELGLFKSDSKAQYVLVIEHGAFIEDTSPATTGQNLAAINWDSTPLLSQRLILTQAPVTRTFGCRVKRSIGGTITSQRIIFGSEAGGDSTPASANFALRARLTRFDTEDSKVKPRGFIGILGLDKSDDDTAPTNVLGRATIKPIA